MVYISVLLITYPLTTLTTLLLETNMNNNPNNWYKASTSFYLTKLEYPYQDFKVVSDELVQLLKANGSVSRVRDDTKRAIKLLSLNLYLRHHQFGEKGIVNVYKKEKIFKKGNVYQDVFGLAFKSFNAVLKGLEELALIKMKLGGIDSKEGKQIRRPTKICATDKFFKLLDAHLDIDTIVVPVEAMIQLKTDKDEIKRYYLEYKRLPTKDKKLTNQIRLKKFNELSQNTIISVGDHTFSKTNLLLRWT